MTPRVVGGEPTTVAKWPSIVALTVRGLGDPFAAQFCGGTLITPQFVLTAAHCISEELGGVPRRALIVRLGTDDLRHGHAVVRRVTSVRVDPQWDPDQLLHDVALLRFERPVAIPPMRLAGPGDAALEAAGASVRVAGWGALLDAPVIYPAHLREAALVVGDPAVCGGDDAWGAGFDPATQVCAGVPDRSRDSCYGDSGGPLAADGPDGAVLVGVVSFGAGCARPGTPYGVYSRVSGLRAWIDAATGPDPKPGRTNASYRRGTLRLSARVVRNGEQAFATFRVERHRVGSLIQPFEPLPAGTGPVSVSIAIPDVPKGRYRVRVVVVTADGVTVAGPARTLRLR